MRQIFLVTLLLLSAAASARADITFTHSGSADPTTEGFSVGAAGGPSTTAALPSDLGKAAWSMTSTTQASQLAYFSGALSVVEKSYIAINGFTLSMEARVLPGLAQPYTLVHPTMIASTLVCTDTRRFEIGLSLDANGDTVVILPSSINSDGTGASVLAPGINTVIPGNDYHLYELKYDPTTTSADLFIDGTNVFTNYFGHTSFVSNSGLVFDSNSGGTANFSSAQLTIVPEPSTMVLIGAVGVLGMIRMRRRA